MKIINKILSGLAVFSVAALMVSCNLTTQSPSTKTEADVFSDPTLTEYQLYSITEAFGHTNSHRGRYLPWYGYNTDIEWYVSNTVDEKSRIAQYEVTATNSQLNVSDNPYNELMTGVERANLAVSRIRKYGSVETRPEMAKKLGEALALRALIYTELLKAYGEVPARFESVTDNTDIIYMNKSDRDVIYKQLLADLEEAGTYLTDYQVQSTDRVGRAFVQGLYARLALMASGYALRPDAGEVGKGNAGSVRLSDDEALSKEVLYPKAYAALKDVIDNSGLSLTSDYKAMWQAINNMDMTGGKEVIYVIPFSNTRGRWNYTFAVRMEGNPAWSTNQQSSRGGQAGPLPTVFYEYGEFDQRRDVSCVNFKWEPNGTGVHAVPAGISDWYFGKYRFEWMTSYPYTGGNDDGVKPVYMRYSDILLMAAEIAADQAAGEYYSLDNAKSHLLEVRKRAYKGHEAEAEAYVSALTSADFFNAIVDERALEFVGEMLRKSDLIRWDLLKTKLDEAKTKLTALGTRSGAYAEVGEYLWYKQTNDGLEMYGIRRGENDVTLDVPPAGSGWQCYTNSEGEPSKYMGKDPFAKKTLYGSEDPNTRQWWPIPAVTLTNSQGALKNDYGF